MSPFLKLIAFATLFASGCVPVYGGMFGVGTNQNATAVTYGTNTVTSIYCGSNLVWKADTGPHYSPASDFTYTTNSGAITITGYVGAGGIVSIPPTINGLSVTRIDDYAFSPTYTGTPSMTGLVLPDGLLVISYGAFQRCSTIVGNVTIPASVTTLLDYCFYGCTGITGVYYPAMTAPTGIAGNAFAGIPGITAYRHADATGYGTVPDSFGGLPTAIW